MRHAGHVCASVPYAQWSVTVWFCHRHQGWMANRHIHSWTGQDDGVSTHDETAEFGPFDDVQDVRKWAEEFLPLLSYLPAIAEDRTLL